MKHLCGVLVVLLASAFTGLYAAPGRAGGPADMMSCAASSEGIRGTFHWSDNGAGKLEIKRADATYACALELKSFEYQPKAEVPFLDLVFERGACSPALPADADSWLLRKIPVFVRPPLEATRHARLQWLRYEDLTDCQVTFYDAKTISSNLDRWKRGGWAAKE